MLNSNQSLDAVCGSFPLTAAFGRCPAAIIDRLKGWRDALVGCEAFLSAERRAPID
jgi:hypothetical protein